MLHICPRCKKPIEDKAYILAGSRRYHVFCYVGKPQVVCRWKGCGRIILHGDPRLEIAHGICPECIREHFPEYADEVLEDDGFCRAADAVSGYGEAN